MSSPQDAARAVAEDAAVFVISVAAEAAVPNAYRADLVPLRRPGNALVVWRPRSAR